MAVAGIPPWVLAGVALAAVAALVIAAVFLVGERLFAREDGADRRRRTGRERGEEIRREEIGDYLDAIGESYETDAEVRGHRVAFFLPDRDVAVTFDPRAYLSLEDSTTHAILVEHEMPGGHVGNRLPFETPDFDPDPDDGNYAGRTVGPGPGSRNRGPAGPGRGRATSRRRATGGPDGAGTDREAVETSFAVLGLAPGASTEAVERAYRRRVKEVHPDHDGDEESFKRVQEAYATAREHAD